MQRLRAALFAIVEENRPCSVRQVYYRGIGTLWDKDRGHDRTNYNDVVSNLGVMRENGELPWGWLVDTGRWVRQDTMYDSLTDALENTHATYRRNLWASQPRRVEVWAESDSTSMLVEDVTRKLGVGLFSCKGQAGKEFAWSSAQAYLSINKPVTILYLGDWDPSGLAIPRSLEDRLNRYSNDAVEITFRRLAVTPEQISSYGLISHDTNSRDSSHQRFAAECRRLGVPIEAVELEAFPAPVLREIVETTLYDAIDDGNAWDATIDAELADLEMLADMAARGWPV
jgi:hypothetical protein